MTSFRGAAIKNYNVLFQRKMVDRRDTANNCISNCLFDAESVFLTYKIFNK